MNEKVDSEADHAQKFSYDPRKAPCVTQQGPAAKKEYLGALLKAHEAWYDVREGCEFAGRTFAGYAEFHSHGEQYVLVKRAKLWEANVHEYLFFEIVDKVDLPYVEDLVAFMTDDALKKVDPEPNHMSSSLTAIVIADEATDDARRRLRKVRFRKDFAFGLRGWADVRLALVELGTGRITVNSAGKEIEKTLRANLDLMRAETEEKGRE